MKDLESVAVPPRSGKPARQLIVFLHGIGVDGDDLIGLADPFAESLPDALFLAPHAPFACDMAPMGRQWFSLRDIGPQSLADGLATVRPIFDAWLDKMMQAHNLTEEKVALVGFSQGTMLALYSALRRPRPVAGVLGFSGLLAAPEKLPDELVSKPPVLLIHGQEDPVVNFGFLDLARRALELLDVPVRAMARPGLGHSIDEVGLFEGISFVQSALNPTLN